MGEKKLLEYAKGEQNYYFWFRYYFWYLLALMSIKYLC